MNKLQKISFIILSTLLINTNNFPCAIIKSPELENQQESVPLLTAISQSRIDDAIRIVESGDVINSNVIDKAFRRMITRAYYDDPALRLIELLIASGADVNTHCSDTDNRSVLSYVASATDRGSVSVVRLLLENGADINYVDTGVLGRSALYEAVSSGNMDVINLLLERGADSTVRDQIIGGSILDTAVLSSRQNRDIKIIIERLLAAGCDINGIDRNGNTALLKAASHGNTKAVIALIQLGANINLANSGATTPLKAAYSAGHEEIAAILLASGAKPDNVANSRTHQTGYEPGPVDKNDLRMKKKNIMKLIKKEPARRKEAMKKWKQLSVNEISNAPTVGNVLPLSLIELVSDYSKFDKYEDLPIDNAIMVSTENTNSTRIQIPQGDTRRLGLPLENSNTAQLQLSQATNNRSFLRSRTFMYGVTGLTFIITAIAIKYKRDNDAKKDKDNRKEQENSNKQLQANSSHIIDQA